ncbi:MAG TPA: RNA pyrophosphohydrolase, partial [Citreicella sp.]|nr:RNA pyrophosphohydrolase [Citreicella sp.]
GSDDQVNIATEHPEFSRWCWLPADQVLDQIVPFKRPVYEQVIAAFGARL